MWGEDVCPTTHRPHLHGLLLFTGGIRRRTLRTHIEGANLIAPPGKIDALKLKRYVLQKANVIQIGTDDERSDRPDRSFGQGSRTDLYRVQDGIHNGDSMLDTAKKYFPLWCQYGAAFDLYRTMTQGYSLRGPITVEVYWGVTGAGKSHTAFVRDPQNTFILTRKNTGLWFCGYHGQKILLVDEFSHSWISLSQLKRICDPAGYPMILDVKRGHAMAMWTHVIITCNAPIQLWYPNVSAKFKEPLFRRLKDRFYFARPYEEQKPPVTTLDYWDLADDEEGPLNQLVVEDTHIFSGPLNLLAETCWASHHTGDY